ncbi:MAG: chorismate--pyruvate lyase [Chitinophagales bacterium]|jgi:chorismate--pyruvate lyase
MRQLFNDAISLKHPRASRWFDHTHLFARKLDAGVISWLNDQGSLTKRLMDYCPGQFSVRVLSQQWIRPQTEEAKLLAVPRHQLALLRQVQLLCGDTVCVYARSIIPLATLQGGHQRLKRLGNKPLGGYLFAQSNLKRSNQHIARIIRKDPLFDIALPDAAQDCDQLWGRRSLFSMGKKSLLVSEFFLPALFSEEQSELKLLQPKQIEKT